MKKLSLNLKNDTYDIIIEDDILNHLSFYIKEVYKNKKIYIITDDNVADIYLKLVLKNLKADFEVDYVIIKNGEESKNIQVYSQIVEQLLNKNIRRNELLLALGGGVVGDLTGFVAATLFRGLPYIGIPTSLLSQMDSSIGGKTGIDFSDRKNILGCFKQPLRVLIDPLALNTLSKKEFNNGMGELIKHACIGNKNLFTLLKQTKKIDEEIIYQSLLVKKHFVEIDEFDLKERMILNFGHTFGHIIELENNLKHGEAVSLGIVMALKLGIDLKISQESDLIQIIELLKLYDLPCYEIDYKPYLLKTLEDKKNLAGTINFILLEELEKPIIYPLNENKLKEILLWM